MCLLQRWGRGLKNCWPMDLREKRCFLEFEGIKGWCLNHDVLLSFLGTFYVWGKMGVLLSFLSSPKILTGLWWANLPYIAVK